MFALLLLHGAPIRAADTDEVLTGWLAAQTNLHTWSANFVQTRKLKALTQPLIATGHISFAAPNRFRWELGRPAQTIALRNADEMVVVYPRLKRAERYPMGENTAGEWREMLSLLDAGFPRDRVAFDARFILLSIVETNRSWQIRLQPRGEFARRMVKEIQLGLATNDYSLISNELIFVDGSSMGNVYTNKVLNPPLDSGVFSWRPEPGFKITEPMGK